MPILTRQALFDLQRSPPLFNMPAPQTATTTATLTSAQMLGEILQALPEGATATYTTLTGTLLEDAFPPGSLFVGASFDLWIINTETDANGNIVLAMGTGITLVGNNDIEEEDAVANSSSAHFRFRRTAANTWSCYRMA